MVRPLRDASYVLVAKLNGGSRGEIRQIELAEREHLDINLIVSSAHLTGRVHEDLDIPFLRSCSYRDNVLPCLETFQSVLLVFGSGRQVIVDVDGRPGHAVNEVQDRSHLVGVPRHVNVLAGGACRGRCPRWVLNDHELPALYADLIAFPNGGGPLPEFRRVAQEVDEARDLVGDASFPGDRQGDSSRGSGDADGTQQRGGGLRICDVRNRVIIN